MPRRAEAALRELRHRVHALEERLGRLESGRAPPGDGRSALPTPPARPVPTCRGCGLPLRARAGRCRECGMPLRP